MERRRWPSASRGGRAPQKKRRSSPLPETVGCWAGASRQCRRRLFGSRPEPGSLKRKVSVKSLPKIKENEVAQLSYSCNQSNQVNVKKSPDLGNKEEKIEDFIKTEEKSEYGTAHQKESLMTNTGSLKNAEVTSSPAMTLPTGVSTYLLQCLDVESTADYNPGASSSPSSFSSPEIFRDEGSEQFNFYSEEFSKYKNSTLLDTSKAVAIDKIPQISNLSAILEPVLEDFQGKSTKRQKPSNFNFTSSALNVSTTVAGKKACKITAARERTPDLESDMRCSSPLGLARKPDNQTAKSKRLLPKEKGKKSNNTLEEETSSVRQPDASGSAAAGSTELAAEVLPSQQAGAVGPLCARRQICCIVGTSPRRRAPRPRQVPVSTREFWLAKGVPEDNITNPLNWTCLEQR